MPSKRSDQAPRAQRAGRFITRILKNIRIKKNPILIGEPGLNLLGIVLLVLLQVALLELVGEN